MWNAMGWAWVAALAVGCASGEMGPPDTGRSDAAMRSCAPGETRACVCLNGAGMGGQACNVAGSAYGDCMPCAATMPRCGDGMCGGSETCSSCTMDCGACTARCGDGMCNGTETCTSCAADCGACMMTPRCGDGMCNGTETCIACSDDCGACPPRCGDGVCNGTEGCTTCAADCMELCGGSCTACSANIDCPSGAFCGPRRCDGARGCYATAASLCGTIGAQPCPATSAYNLCALPEECGPFAVCQRFGDGRAFCSRRCGTNADCPAAPPDAPTLVPTCDLPTMRCYLRCTGPGSCPFGLSCFRFGDGTYGYCS